jgi:hypothetical protein
VTQAMQQGRPLPAFRPSDVPSGQSTILCVCVSLSLSLSLFFLFLFSSFYDSIRLDYVSCPHCHRNFNEQAARRHIPLYVTPSNSLTLYVISLSSCQGQRQRKQPPGPRGNQQMNRVWIIWQSNHLEKMK